MSELQYFLSDEQALILCLFINKAHPVSIFKVSALTA